MLKVDIHIEIGEYIMNYANDIEIISSALNMTDTCVLKLPKNIFYNKTHASDIFKIGDKVVIKLGYDADLVQEFVGYISSIDRTTPVILKCEDEMWNFKKKIAAEVGKKNVFSNASLSDIINRLIPSEITKHVQDIKIGNWSFEEGNTVAKELQRLKDIGIYSYFRNNEFYSHIGTLEFEQVNDANRKAKFHFQKNILDGHSLELINPLDKPIKIIAKSHTEDGSEIKVELGDTQGEIRELYFMPGLKKDELKKLAEGELKKHNKPRIKGSFTSFGFPYVSHGMVAILNDNEKILEGEYFIDKITTTVNLDSGYKRIIELGWQANTTN